MPLNNPPRGVAGRSRASASISSTVAAVAVIDITEDTDSVAPDFCPVEKVPKQTRTKTKMASGESVGGATNDAVLQQLLPPASKKQATTDIINANAGVSLRRSSRVDPAANGYPPAPPRAVSVSSDGGLRALRLQIVGGHQAGKFVDINLGMCEDPVDHGSKWNQIVVGTNADGRWVADTEVTER